MRPTLFAIFALGTAAFAQQHSPTGSYGNILHPGVPSPGALRAPPPHAPAAWTTGHESATEDTAPTAVTPSTFPIQFTDTDTASVSITSPGVQIQPRNLRSPAKPPAPLSGNRPTPTVIINQNFQTDSVHPQFRDYSNTPLPNPAPSQGSSVA